MSGDIFREEIVRILRESAGVREGLADECADAAASAARAVASCFRRGGKVLVFGNGGSAADAQHLAAELVGRFSRDREPLPAIALTTDTSALTAISNDFGFEKVFERQVEALGRPGDVAIAISTSGTSANILAAVEKARDLGLRTIGLTGAGREGLAERVDVAIVAPTADTARAQECHLAIEHALCGAVEKLLFAGTPEDSRTAHGRILDWPSLLDLREAWRRAGRVVVWTNGCFDLLHVGHLRSLQGAKNLGDVLVVGVNGDDSVHEQKGPGRPVLGAADRAELVAALEPVDYVVIFEEPTPEQALERLRPDVHAKGADYAPPNGKAIPERALVESYGGEVRFIPLVPKRSTTDLLARIRESKAADE